MGDEARLRALRLRALADSPGASAASAEQEAQLPAAHWAELARQSQAADHLAIYLADGGGEWLGLGAGRWHDRERAIAQLWRM